MKRALSLMLVLVMAAMLLTGLAGCGETATEDKAPVHFIQFFDPDCPFCQAMEPTIEKLQKEYQQKALDLKRFQDDAQRELEELQRRELTELEKKVLPVIETVSKELGYSLVFNKFQSGLLYADDAVDITAAVIQKFHTAIAAAPKTDAKPAAAAPAPKK